VGGKINVIEEAMDCEEFFEGSCNQVLVHIPNDDDMVASV
jgi:hypothetical protein